MRIPANEIESELKILWTREMLSGAYRPVWLNTQVDGKPLKTLSFAANPSHNRFIGKKSFEEQATLIAAAQGVFGKNRDYLYNTVTALEAHGIMKSQMHDLARRVRALAGD
jgi:cation transport protein ChaC